MENLNQVQNSNLSSKWTLEKIYTSCDLFFEDLIQKIRCAQHSIRIEFYIFEKAELGKRIIDSLKESVKRGVHVRLLIDGFGSPDWTEEDLTKLQEFGIEARIYRPYPWIRQRFHKLKLLLQLHRLSGWAKYLNRRNHRKTILIDDTQLFTGSANVCHTHLHSIHGSKAWRDTCIYLEGEEALHAIEAFEKAWQRAWSPFPSLKSELSISLPNSFYPTDKSLIRLNHERFLRLFFFYDLLEKINQAEKRIWITNAYFIPLALLLRALKQAHQRGVEIKIIVPYKSDVRVVQWVSALLLSRLSFLGIQIYEYLPSVLHAKTVIIDNFAMVGSSNFNYRSFRHDLEIDAVITKKESLQALENHFLEDLQKSQNLKESKQIFRQFFFISLGRIFIFLKKYM